MNASEEKQAFARGIADFCSRNGTPEFSAPLAKFAEYSDAFELDPKAFASGFDGFIKKAYRRDRDSTLKKILPWLLVPAGIYGAARLGDMWGRHAQATDNDRGPITGPLMSLIENLTGKKYHYIGRNGAKAISTDWKLKPLTAEENENLYRFGTKTPQKD